MNEEDFADKIHGFYSTAEGRNVLREVYPRFLARAPFGDTKISSMISDENFADQDKEDRLTRAALRRWTEEGQSELWRSDLQKTIRVLRKLEVQMMAQTEIQQLLRDRAISVRQMDIVKGISTFFSPSKPEGREKLRMELAKLDGIFKIFRGYVRESDMEKNDLTSDGRYWVLKMHTEHPLLVCHEFTVDENRRVHFPVFRNRQCGFLLHGNEDGLLRFMLDYANPSHRWIELYRPTELYGIEEMDGVPGGPAVGEMAYRTTEWSWQELFAQRRRDRLYSRENTVLRKMTDEWSRVVYAHFSRQVWDVPV